MANSGHVELLKRGLAVWNAWRSENPDIRPDLRGADLSFADLSGANLYHAMLGTSNLFSANLRAANLIGANFHLAYLHKAVLINAHLGSAMLGEADLSSADLSGADLRGAELGWANLSGANLNEADLRGAHVAGTIFSDNDLSTINGLDTVSHGGPSSIAIDTLFKSDGKIPEVFLRGAGVPEDFITFIPSLIGRAIEFYSCFISYSHQDIEFAQRLHSRMRSENLRVWYAPEDMKGGRKVHEEIFRAIQIYDKLLVVLSENSIRSEWVMTEIRRAVKVEREEKRRKLFPIQLVDLKSIQTWECFDVDSGKDLAIELREYHIPDFSNWKDHDSFEKEFARLLRDLKANEA